MNALFLEDINAIKDDDELVSLEKAIKLGAIIMWNHPARGDDNSDISKIHEKLLKEGKIDMIEIVNSFEYYPKAISHADKYNLAYAGNSDSHKSIYSDYGDTYRPITLVFAKEKNAASIKEAIKQRRTVSFFDNMLFGSDKYLRELVKSCLSYKVVTEEGNITTLNISNNSDIEFTVTNETKQFIIPKSGNIKIMINTKEPLVFDNCFITAKKHLTFDSYKLL